LESLALFTSDKELSKQIMSRWTQTDNPTHLERSYQDAIGSMERVPFTSVGTIQTVLDQLAPQIPAARTAKPEDFIENRFVQEVVDSRPDYLRP
jgi:hypothetical protein